jgi:hypothetical protein
LFLAGETFLYFTGAEIQIEAKPPSYEKRTEFPPRGQEISGCWICGFKPEKKGD